MSPTRPMIIVLNSTRLMFSHMEFFYHILVNRVELNYWAKLTVCKLF